MRDGRSARRVLVRGRVQGVFFRDEMKRHAEAEAITGWVSNRDDGALEAWLEGDAAALDRLLDWARGGPRGAGVERVDVESVESRGYTGFEVR